MIGERNGRAKAGPYRDRRPASAGAGRYRCPACEEGFSPSQRTDPLQRVRGGGVGLEFWLDYFVKDHKRVPTGVYGPLKWVQPLLARHTNLSGFSPSQGRDQL